MYGYVVVVELPVLDNVYLVHIIAFMNKWTYVCIFFFKVTVSWSECFNKSHLQMSAKIRGEGEEKYECIHQVLVRLTPPFPPPFSSSFSSFSSSSSAPSFSFTRLEVTLSV